MSKPAPNPYRRDRFVLAEFLVAACLVCAKAGQPSEHWDHDLKGRVCRDCAPATANADDLLADTPGLTPPPDGQDPRPSLNPA